MIRLIFLLLFIASGLLLNAQISKEAYQRADSVSKFRNMVLNDVLELDWMDSTAIFWYKTRITPDTIRFYIVDAKRQEKRSAFDHERVAQALKEGLKINAKSNQLGLSQLKFSDDIQSFTFEHKDSLWKCHFADDYRLEVLNPVKKVKNGGHWGQTRDELGNDVVVSPDGKRETFIRNFNLFVRDLDTEKVVQLSFDGAAGDLYSSYVSWSPDSRYLTTNKVRLHEKQYMRFMESSPKEQLLPKLHEIEYLRPGDALPIHRPTLFDVDQEKQIAVDARPFENQYSISNVKWLPKSKAFTFEYNQRGHQRYQVVRVDVESGETRIIIDEHSDTFIDYSGKRYCYDVEDTGEIIWASERDGWNHLYLFDGETGKMKNAITSGEWVVRGVEYVNTDERFIIFRGNIYRPTNFDPQKSYPIIEYIYAGPHSSFVQKSFRPYMAPFSSLAELGFIIVQIDGMGTSNRSKAFHDVCYKNLKDAGFPDRIQWIKAAAQKYSYMDPARVGIFGASAGGQSAMGAVLFYSDFYRAAVASCGCHDNRMDKMWWNEQWMGYPVGPYYAESSNVENAKLLEGHLLLIIGENDDNVDPASTMQAADALIDAGKDFELLVLPGVNHTLGGKYGERKRRDFFIRTLLKVSTPSWNR